MSFVLAFSWRRFVLAMRDRHCAYQNEIAIFGFSVTAKNFSHGVLPDEDHRRFDDQAHEIGYILSNCVGYAKGLTQSPLLFANLPAHIPLFIDRLVERAGLAVILRAASSEDNHRSTSKPDIFNGSADSVDKVCNRLGVTAV
jgi:hypothetical protein